MILPGPSRRRFATWGTMLTLAAHGAFADDDPRIRPLNHAAWRQECGACHVAYPPQLLPAASWRAIMNGLDQHFGADAALDPQQRADILRFLETNAGRGRGSTGGKPTLRIRKLAGLSTNMPRNYPPTSGADPA